jgi:hypothetical protein
MTRLCSPRKPSARRTTACRHDTDTHARVTCTAADDSDTAGQTLTAAASLRGAIAAVLDGADVACVACAHHQQQPTSSDTTPRQQQHTTHRRSRRVTSACPSRCHLSRSEEGEATTQTETSHASSSAAAATAHTHRSRRGARRSHRGCSRRSDMCLRQQQHVSDATHDHAGEAATNGPQRPLTAAGPAVGAVAGAAACITPQRRTHSDGSSHDGSPHACRQRCHGCRPHRSGTTRAS